MKVQQTMKNLRKIAINKERFTPQTHVTTHLEAFCPCFKNIERKFQNLGL